LPQEVDSLSIIMEDDECSELPASSEHECFELPAEPETASDLSTVTDDVELPEEPEEASDSSTVTDDDVELPEIEESDELIDELPEEPEEASDSSTMTDDDEDLQDDPEEASIFSSMPEFMAIEEACRAADTLRVVDYASYEDITKAIRSELRYTLKAIDEDEE